MAAQVSPAYAYQSPVPEAVIFAAGVTLGVVRWISWEYVKTRVLTLQMRDFCHTLSQPKLTQGYFLVREICTNEAQTPCFTPPSMFIELELDQFLKPIAPFKNKVSIYCFSRTCEKSNWSALPSHVLAPPPVATSIFELKYNEHGSNGSSEPLRSFLQAVDYAFTTRRAYDSIEDIPDSTYKGTRKERYPGWDN